jgi:hypothetical protein
VVIPRKIAKLDLANVPMEIKLEFKRNFSKIFAEVDQSKSVDKILEFSGQLRKFSKKTDCEEFNKVSLVLKSACENFEIENIEIVLSLIKRILDEQHK